MVIGLLLSLALQISAIADTAIVRDTLTGTITAREEIWNRRSNPLMGRPDWLEEIRWTVQTPDTNQVRISVKGRELLIKNRGVWKGSKGTYIVTGPDSLYQLTSFKAEHLAKPEPKPAPPSPAPQPNPKPERKPWEKSGRELRDKPEEQTKMVKLIAKRFGLKKAEYVQLLSNSGPRPPKGGYVYWGVRGIKNGTWHIWQYNNKKLRKGRELVDPQRYNK